MGNCYCVYIINGVFSFLLPFFSTSIKNTFNSIIKTFQKCTHNSNKFFYSSLRWSNWMLLDCSKCDLRTMSYFTHLFLVYVVVVVIHVVFLKYLTKMVYKYERKILFWWHSFVHGTYFGCHSERKETEIFSPNIYLINAVRSSFFVCSLFCLFVIIIKRLKV